MVNLCISPDLAEKVHHTGEDHKQNAAAGAEPEDFREEALVEGSKTLLTGDSGKGGPGPAVLRGSTTSNAGAVLNAGLDDVHGGVENSTDGATDGPDQHECGGTGRHVLQGHGSLKGDQRGLQKRQGSL